ncbi:MAG: hypothetical protein ACK4ZW_08565 [Blastomonas sp.]
MNITLEAPWTYRTPLRTVTYPAGVHDVTQPIAKAALADGVIAEEPDDGQGTAATAAPRRTRKTQG